MPRRFFVDNELDPGAFLSAESPLSILGLLRVEELGRAAVQKEPLTAMLIGRQQVSSTPPIQKLKLRTPELARGRART